MRKLTLGLATLMLLFVLNSMQVAVAQVGVLTAPAQKKAAEGEITKISFVNGETYDNKIPSSLDPLTKAVKEVYSGASFKVEKDTLMVGLNLDGAKGEVLSVSVSSDCPVNSQYRYKKASGAIAKVLRPTLEAWTRVRHADKGLADAKVKEYKETDSSAEVILAPN